jgi:hypothetical protein
MTHPDAAHTLRHLAHRLQAQADRLPNVIRHMAHELVILGYPTTGSDREKVTGSSSTIAVEHTDNGRPEIDHVPVTPTERAMLTRYELTAYRDDIRDAINDLVARVDAISRLLDKAERIRVPKAERDELERERRANGQTVCCDMQHGKHGVERWGDALCTRPSVKGGLCQAHYRAWHRARVADGVDVSRDHQPSG